MKRNPYANSKAGVIKAPAGAEKDKPKAITTKGDDLRAGKKKGK